MAMASHQTKGRGFRSFMPMCLSQNPRQIHHPIDGIPALSYSAHKAEVMGSSPIEAGGFLDPSARFVAQLDRAPLHRQRLTESPIFSSVFGDAAALMEAHGQQSISRSGCKPDRCTRRFARGTIEAGIKPGPHQLLTHPMTGQSSARFWPGADSAFNLSAKPSSNNARSCVIRRRSIQIPSGGSFMPATQRWMVRTLQSRSRPSSDCQRGP